MLVRSVFTPYYSEDVMYSKAQLEDRNVDGITILYYLQTIVPGFRIHLKVLFVESSHYTDTKNIGDILYIRLVLQIKFSFSPNRTGCVNADEWKNFLERMFPGADYNQLGHYLEADIPEADILQLRLWASYRGQTLARTGGWCCSHLLARFTAIWGTNNLSLAGVQLTCVLSLIRTARYDLHRCFALH